MSAIDIERWRRASPHLDRVLDLPPPEREAFLSTLRAESPQVADDVAALLAEHRLVTAEGFLDNPAVARPEPALAGLTLGAYTLESPIGYGGMGSVWLASRSDGRFEGRAALKLLNAALVGRGVEERFRREGTILARLTHPHIARLIDAGVSATGQPYLVLEHIEGRHIDRYCDDERLGIDGRIRLFLDVQAAVAHAHASLIVHRDLKPSNVLVTGRGEVKLLDFGIAKLLEEGTGQVVLTKLTRDGEYALTPRYAAPEQVSGGPITTATDVYSLGVILFELLSGQHPTGSETQTPAEFVKTLAEVEPRRLSAAAASGDSTQLAERAALRSTTPDRLLRQLRGDLETIVAKALKTDPAERYGSVAEFADDLRRYLDHQPITARADALGYRAAKFVARHRRAVAALSIGVALIVGLVAFYTARLSAERDRAQAEAARASRVSELVIGLITSADPYADPGQSADARDPAAEDPLEIVVQRIDRELAGEPALQARMLTMIGRTYERRGQYAKALPLEERALEMSRAALGPEHPVLADSLNNLGVLHRALGNLERSEPLLRESLAMRRRVLGNEDQDVAVTLVELGRALVDTGRSNDAEPLFREALEIRRKVFGDEHRETATSKSDLGLLLLNRGDIEAAEPMLRENAETTARLLGPGHPNTAAARSSVALLLLAKGDFADAERTYREAAELYRRSPGEQSPPYAQALNNLAAAIELQGRHAEAQATYEACLRIAEALFDADHPRVLQYSVNLARVRVARGEGTAVEAPLRRILSARMKLYPEGDWRIAQARSLLAAALLAQKRYAEAEPLMLAADEALKPVPGAQGRERDANRARLVALYERLGKPGQADAYR